MQDKRLATRTSWPLSLQHKRYMTALMLLKMPFTKL